MSQDRRAFLQWQGQVGVTHLAKVTCITPLGAANTTTPKRKALDPCSRNYEDLYYKSLFRAALVICCGCDSRPKLADQIPYIVKKETKKDRGVIQSAYITCLK